jgi:uncharacterized SAM-binding protein YcdF (DUF218 family)
MVPPTLLLVVFPLAVFFVSFAIEPRKLRTGIYLSVALAWLAMYGLGFALSTVTRIWDELAGDFLLLGLLVVAALAVGGLAVFLIVAGITLVLKEGFQVNRLASIALGLVMLGLPVVGWFLVSKHAVDLLGWLVLLGIPAGYLGFGFVVFVIYGSFYPAWMAHFGGPVEVVVVLGSGLIGDRVPPLLASRLRRGRLVFERSVAAGRDVRLVTSGGRGKDEHVAEAVAMRDFLVREGTPAEAVLTEERSRNTKENLNYTAELLARRGLSGPVAVVTSDFHALRAALLMRKAGLPGYAVGSKTARYFWPTAVMREYVAVLRDHRWLNAAMIVVTCLPLAVAILTTLAR